MKERTPYSLQFDPFTALKSEIETLKHTVQTQQEAVNDLFTVQVIYQLITNIVLPVTVHRCSQSVK